MHRLILLAAAGVTMACTHREAVPSAAGATPARHPIGAPIRFHVAARVQVLPGFPLFHVTRADGRSVELSDPGENPPPPFIGSEVLDQDFTWDQQEYVGPGEKRQVAPGRYRIGVSEVADPDHPGLARARVVCEVLIE